MSSSVDFQEHQETQCRGRIASELQTRGIPDELVTQVIPILLESWETSYVPRMPPDAIGLMVRRKGWVIRNSDLEVVKTLLGAGGLGGIVSAAAVNQALLSPAVGFVVGLLGTCFGIYRNAASKGAHVDNVKLMILVALREVRRGDGATAADISGYLSPHFPITKAEVLEELQLLNKYLSTSGAAVTLAHEDVLTKLWKTDC